MPIKRRVVENPLEFIKKCVRNRKIFWTYHANMRLKGRFIPRKYILESVNLYDIIETYPQDKYFPSYLVYSKYDGKILHILFATDVKGENVQIITVYYPDTEEWNEDFKTRRFSQ